MIFLHVSTVVGRGFAGRWADTLAAAADTTDHKPDGAFCLLRLLGLTTRACHHSFHLYRHSTPPRIVHAFPPDGAGSRSLQADVPVPHADGAMSRARWPLCYYRSILHRALRARRLQES